MHQTERKRETRLALAGLLFVLYYYASPYVTEHGLRAAVRSGDADRISAYVDFPALRQNIREQVVIKLAGRMGYGNSGAALAGLRLLPGNRAADALIDTYVSRDGIAQLLTAAGGNMNVRTDDLFANASDGFAGLVRFRITLHPDGRSPVNLYLQRGLLSWRLAGVEIPDEVFDRLQANGIASSLNAGH